jgi:hypothetical protein
MKDTIIILHAEKVEYARKGADGQPTGEMVRFCRIQYVSDEPQDDGRYKGYSVSEGTAPVEVFDSVELTPGLYETEFRKQPIQDRWGNSKVSLEPVSAEFVGDPGLVFDAAAVK